MESETLHHFIHCNGYRDLWRNIYDNVKASIIKGVNRYMKGATASQTNAVINTLIGPSFDSEPFEMFKELTSDAKCSKITFKQLITHNRLSTSAALDIATRALKEFIRTFRQTIWKTRCAKTVEWESCNNITNSIKRKLQIYDDIEWDIDDN
jgi:hypothetical protein